MCAVLDDTRYTGYDEDGYYCEAASPALDEEAHLLLHSGRLGVVVDAGGLKAPANSHTRNLFPRLGATSGTEGAPRVVYDALDATSTNITLEVVCGSGSDSSSYTLGIAEGDFVQVGLVRQGVCQPCSQTEGSSGSPASRCGRTHTCVSVRQDTP